MQDNLIKLFEVMIPGRVGIKKNSRQIFKNQYGGVKNLPSRNYQDWERLAASYVSIAIRKWGKSLPIKTPIVAYYQFHFKNKRALPDTSNCIEGPQDLLEKLNVYENDRQIFKINAERFVDGSEKVVIAFYMERG